MLLNFFIRIEITHIRLKFPTWRFTMKMAMICLIPDMKLQNLRICRKFTEFYLVALIDIITEYYLVALIDIITEYYLVALIDIITEYYLVALIDIITEFYLVALIDIITEFYLVALIDIITEYYLAVGPVDWSGGAENYTNCISAEG